jgi:predicted TIM-barrel fold metal-dependent hydrolase
MTGINKEEYEKALREFEEAQKEYYKVVPILMEPLSENTIQKPINLSEALPKFKKYVEKRNALYGTLRKSGK